MSTGHNENKSYIIFPYKVTALSTADSRFLVLPASGAPLSPVRAFEPSKYDGRRVNSCLDILFLLKIETSDSHSYVDLHPYLLVPDAHIDIRMRQRTEN